MSLYEDLKRLRDECTPGHIFACGYRRGVVSVKYRPEEDIDVADFDINHLSSHEEIEANKALFIKLVNHLDDILNLVEAGIDIEECPSLSCSMGYRETQRFTEALRAFTEEK